MCKQFKLSEYRSTTGHYNIVTTHTVVNILEVELSPEETNLLLRGLNFAPQSPWVNRFQLKKDLETFDYRLRIREFFYNSVVMTKTTTQNNLQPA